MPRAISNPPNPWLATDVDWDGEPPPAELEVFEEEAKSALVKNESPDVGFTWGCNPYRGCYHGCSYCYARRTHEYLGWGAGTDFERKIVVKTNIAKVLRREVERESWKGDTIVFSGVTDCYQPLEAAWRLTRKCLEVCLEYQNPVVIITKSAMVARDVELLAALAERTAVRVMLSIPFADDEMGRKFEPYASLASKRLRALEALSRAGVLTGVSMAPIIPGVNDSDIPRVLERARNAGATSCFMTLLRLPGSVANVFDVRLEDVLPDRAKKVRNAILEMREGKMNDSRFGSRMQGHGERWAVVESLFEHHRKRLGYDDVEKNLRVRDGAGNDASAGWGFRRPKQQLSLF